MSDPKAAFWLLLSSIVWPIAEATAQSSEAPTVAVRAGEKIELEAPDRGTSLWAWADDEDSADWKEGTIITAPKAEGSYWLALRTRDDVGQLSSTAWHRVRVDETSPSVSIGLDDTPASAWWGSGATAHCNAEDLSPIGSRRWLEPAQTDAASALRFSTTGLLTVACEAFDEVGNAGRGDRLVPIDTEPPFLALQLEDGMPLRKTDDGRWLLRSTRVHPTVRDSAAGVAETTFRVDGRPVEGPWLPTPGDHVLELSATDRLGQSATMRVAATSVAGPPRLEVSLKADGVERSGTTYFRGPVTVEAATDEGAELRWSPDGATWLTGAGSVSTEESWVVFRATDRAGARSYRRVELPRDEEGPDAEIETGNGLTWPPALRVEVGAGETVTVRISDGASGTTRFRVGHRRPGLPRFTAPATGDADGSVELVLGAGRHLVRVVAEDALGNRSEHRWRIKVRK